MNNIVNVLITHSFPEALITTLREVSPRLRLTVHPARKPEDIPPEEWARAEVLYTERVLPAPEQAPNLKWVQFHLAGIEHALDHPLMSRPELIVTSLSGAASSQMAEYALMMLLALGHRLPDLFANQMKAEWPKDKWERFSPKELRGSTVGIVGYGSIGRQIARLLQPFGATVLAAKRDVMHPEDQEYTPEGMGDPKGELFKRLYPTQALRSMFRECDFVVVCVPLTPETRNLITKEELDALPLGACLVDISRGGVVDHAALLEALQSRKLSGAALDVFPEEPLPPTSPLWKMPNVLITPHISGDSPHYNERAVALFAENLNRYLAGLPLYNRYDPNRGY